MRETALSEARALLELGGPEQVKARELAVRLGVSVGTIYNLFGDLDELLFHVNGQVYDELKAHVLETLAEARAHAPGAKEEMLALSRGYLQFVAANQDLWAGCLAFNRRRKVSVPEWYREKERGLFRLIDETLATLPGATDLETRKMATRSLWAAVHGIVTVSVGRDGLLATENDVWEQISLVVTAVANQLASQTA